MPKKSPALRQGLDINIKIGNRLRSARELMQLSQRQIGEALDVTFQQVQKYENGLTSITVDRLFDFAAVVGMPVLTLLEDLEIVDDQSKTGTVLKQFKKALLLNDTLSLNGIKTGELMAVVEWYCKVEPKAIRAALSALLSSIADESVAEVQSVKTKDPVG